MNIQLPLALASGKEISLSSALAERAGFGGKRGTALLLFG
jgi:hypothetical protein